MNTNFRSRKILAALLAGVGLTAGAAGVANAVSNPTAPVTTQQGAGPAAPTGAAPDAAEVNDGRDAADGKEAADDGATEATSDGVEPADAAYTASITAPGGSGNEADESANLAPLAKITPAEATTAALAAVPGTAGTATLENENGFIVYGITVTTPKGVIDVKVDAGNGKVLAQDSDADSGNGDD